MKNTQAPALVSSSEIRPSHVNAVYLGLSIWLALRVLTSLWAAVVSIARPLSELEQSVELWPPSPPWQAWLERVFLSPWQRWDAHWYLRIVTEGYAPTDGTLNFHPLYPWLAKPLYAAGADAMLSLMLVSAAAGILTLVLFTKLARLDQQPTDAQTSLLLFIFFPVAFVLFAPYTEGLFLACTLLLFWLARRRQWWLAALAGALATLTRQQGLMLILPLAWEMWAANDKNPRRLLKQWQSWTALSLIPAALGVWLLYRVSVVGERIGPVTSPMDLISSLVISASSSKVVPNQTFMWPWQALILAIQKALTSPDLDILINLGLGLWFLVLLSITWKSMRPSYLVYTLIMVLLAFGYQTGQTHPYMGLVRHLWIAFPVFLYLGPKVKHPALRLSAVSLGLAGMLFLILQYVLEAWVP